MKIIDKKILFKSKQKFNIQRYDILKSWQYPLHKHKGFSEFLYIARGKISVPFENKTINLKTGDLLLIRENDSHSLKSGDVLFFNVNFHHIDLMNAASILGKKDLVKLFYNQKYPPCFSVSNKYRLGFEQQLQNLFTHQNASHGNDLLIKYLISILVDIIHTNKSDEIISEKAPTWFLELLKSIEDQIDYSISVSELTKICNRSSEHISRSFKKYLKVTPSHYINEVRLERASLRLAHTNENILGISMDCGYQNLNYFYKLFKIKYGITPREYRLKYYSY